MIKKTRMIEVDHRGIEIAILEYAIKHGHVPINPPKTIRFGCSMTHSKCEVSVSITWIEETIESP